MVSLSILYGVRRRGNGGGTNGGGSGDYVVSRAVKRQRMQVFCGRDRGRYRFQQFD